MIYSTRRFVVCLTMCHFILVFFSPFSIAITSLGEERANLSAFRTFVRFVLVLDLSVSSSSWCLGRAAVCDCGTPWTFLLPFLDNSRQRHMATRICNEHQNHCLRTANRKIPRRGMGGGWSAGNSLNTLH